MKKAEGSALPMKKPYRPPTIRIYGDLTAITANLTMINMNNADGGMGLLDKTS